MWSLEDNCGPEKYNYVKFPILNKKTIAQTTMNRHEICHLNYRKHRTRWLGTHVPFLGALRPFLGAEICNLFIYLGNKGGICHKLTMAWHVLTFWYVKGVEVTMAMSDQRLNMQRMTWSFARLTRSAAPLTGQATSPGALRRRRVPPSDSSSRSWNYRPWGSLPWSGVRAQRGSRVV